MRSLAAVVGLLALAHALWPDPEERSAGIYRVVTTFGYGHLIGAAWFGRQHVALLRPRNIPASLWYAFVVSGVGGLLGVYAWSLHLAPGLILVFFGLSSWHIAENDLALGRAYRNEGRLPRLPRTPGGHRQVLIATAAVVAAGAATPEMGWTTQLGPGWTGPSLSDVFAAVTGYHLISWVVFMADRARSSSGHAARRMHRALLVVHALPLTICLTLLGLGDRASAAEALVFGPGLYLFWSLLHVLQTAIARELRGAGAGPFPVPPHPSPVTETP